MWLLLKFPDLKRYQVGNEKIKYNYRMTLSVAYPPRCLDSVGLNERVQLSETLSSTNWLPQEYSRHGRVRTDERQKLEEYIADINLRLRIVKASNSKSKALQVRSCVLSQRL